METLTFDELPEAIASIGERLSRIELLLTVKQPEKEPVNQWFDLPELCLYLPDKPARQTVYDWVTKGLVPYHKGGKKLRFLQSEIDAWLLTGRRKTLTEIEAETSSYLKQKTR